MGFGREARGPVVGRSINPIVGNQYVEGTATGMPSGIPDGTIEHPELYDVSNPLSRRERFFNLLSSFVHGVVTLLKNM